MYINTGLIGYPLWHTMSPSLHSHFFDISGVNGGYCCFETKTAAELEKTFEVLNRFDFTGFNITVPYKTDIMPYCKSVNNDALSAGAVNTVKILDGDFIGYNTDIFGFSRLMENIGAVSKNKNVLLLGAGGAAKSVAVYLNENTPTSLTIFNRTMKNGEKLAETCKFNTHVENNIGFLKDKSFDLVINSTSLGLKGEEFPDLKLKHVGIAIDLQYAKDETPFLKSMDNALKKADGFAMLVYQAAKAFEIWTGEKVDPNLSVLNNKFNNRK